MRHLLRFASPLKGLSLSGARWMQIRLPAAIPIPPLRCLADAPPLRAVLRAARSRLSRLLRRRAAPRIVRRSALRDLSWGWGGCGDPPTCLVSFGIAQIFGIPARLYGNPLAAEPGRGGARRGVPRQTVGCVGFTSAFCIQRLRRQGKRPFCAFPRGRNARENRRNFMRGRSLILWGSGPLLGGPPPPAALRSRRVYRG